MNKQEVTARFKELGFSAEDCWVQTGAAMLMHGLREQTHDIDMGCTTELANKIAESGAPYELLPDGRKKFVIGGDVEVSENWERGTVTVIDGVPVVSLKDVIRCKKRLGREKDLIDIERIEKHLSENR